MSRLTVTVVGAGIIGLWQAFELARRGHAVTLREAAPLDCEGAASRFAGAMLAPYCEAESAPPIVQELGLRGIEMWREVYPGFVGRGTLVVTAARDRSELARFARATCGHVLLNAEEIAAYEPALGNRFAQALFYAGEAHVAPRAALAFFHSALCALGAELRFDDPVPHPTWLAGAAGEIVIDCRGIAAEDEIPDLRGVRGEMTVVRAPHLMLKRPIRFLHPRAPLYIVPWGGATYMIGATMVETSHAGPVTLRSALDLLTSACAIHPGLADAVVLEFSSGVRPAFSDNVPGIIAKGRRLFVNGSYRHGFLLAPTLAKTAADYLESGITHPKLFRRTLVASQSENLLVGRNAAQSIVTKRAPGTVNTGGKRR